MSEVPVNEMLRGHLAYCSGIPEAATAFSQRIGIFAHGIVLQEYDCRYAKHRDSRGISFGMVTPGDDAIRSPTLQIPDGARPIGYAGLEEIPFPGFARITADASYHVRRGERHS